jgi:HEXXH motif-containing protein
MALTTHAVTARQVLAIADGTSGADELGILLAGQRSKCLAMLALVVRQAQARRHPEAAAAAAGYRLLAAAQRLARPGADEILRWPAASSWAADTVLGLQSPAAGPVSPGRLALLGAAAAIRGGLPCSVRLPTSACAGPTLVLPSLGRVLLPGWLRGQPITLRSVPGQAELRGPGGCLPLPGQLDGPGPRWRPVRAIAAGSGAARIELRLDDTGSCHAGGEPADWTRLLADAWELLSRDHPRTAAEVAALLTCLTPVRAADGAAVSATSRRAFGAVAMSLPGSATAMALALAHEIQHAKLAALMDLIPMIAGEPADRYYAPWRDDPRPLAGLLQGMYAHLGVAGFWRRHRRVTREPDELGYAHAEFARWRQACADVRDVLSTQPALTEGGLLFVTGMERVLRDWAHDDVPGGALAQARRAAARHRDQWHREHGSGARPGVAWSRPGPAPRGAIGIRQAGEGG